MRLVQPTCMLQLDILAGSILKGLRTQRANGSRWVGP
jgi:hypothetical protein